MKSVVITGSARGFGFALAKEFRVLNYNIVLSDLNEQNLINAKQELSLVSGKGKIEYMVCNVTSHQDLSDLWTFAVRKFKQVDIWINNAGVNQPNKPVSELTQKDIDFLIDIDVKGAIYGSKIAFAGMQKQGFGQIYNVEGYGSDDAMMMGLSIYGTSKRAVTYFTQALAKESKQLTQDKVCVCRLTPGIMITNFLHSANGGATKIELSEKTKKVYNILGDYPETIAHYVVPKMDKNQKNNYKVMWLTGARAFWRFLTCGFNKRDFFKD